MRACRVVFCVLAIDAVVPRKAWAGMPVVTFTDIASMRIEAISFFLVVFLACAWIVQRIWNGLRRDFPRLPKLSYRRALGLTTLWGLLFLLVLSMISGARELMTPGAWKKEGLTYKLANGPDVGKGEDSSPPIDAARRQALERLRTVLWSYAASHNGAYPPSKQTPGIYAGTWFLPGQSGMQFIYVPDQKVDEIETKPRPLAYEPELYGQERFVLMTNGEIQSMTLDQIQLDLVGKEP